MSKNLPKVGRTLGDSEYYPACIFLAAWSNLVVAPLYYAVLYGLQVRRMQDCGACYWPRKRLDLDLWPLTSYL